MIIRDAGVAATLTAQQLRNPIFGRRNDAAAIVASSEQAGFGAGNLLNPMTHLRWKSASTASDVTLDFVMNAPLCNFVAFALHNFGTETITVFARTGGSPPTLTQVFAPTLGGNGKPLIIEFPQGPYTDLQIKFHGPGAARVLSAAVLYSGLLLRMPRSVKVDVEQVPINWGNKTDLLSGWSESGQFLGRLVRNEAFEAKMSFSNVLHSDFGTVASPLEGWFLNEIVNSPFFVAWAPADYVFKVGYVWATENVNPLQSMVTERFSFTIPMRGIA